jgi:tricorn protease
MHAHPPHIRRLVPACCGAVLLTLAALFAPPVLNAAEVKLARHPDYHDGKIVFSYLGDLWLVNDDGANPRRLTVHPARDIHPRFSPDGKWIAFSSNRYGNYDVFVMPAAGGPAKRLTYHSANDTVVGWSPDSRRVLFTSARGLLYPGIPSLYTVPADGGLEQPVPTDWGSWGSYSPDGKQLAFNRHPIPWSRKHYRGSYCADLWVMDAEGKNFRRVLDNDLKDEMKPNNLWPMFGHDGTIYFVSDRAVTARAGSPEVLKSVNNIWKISVEGGKPEQVTHHTSGSLFYPSISSDGKVIVYEENFGLWKLDTATGDTKEIKIDVVSDDRENNLESLTVNGDADSFQLSPTGKRAVISTHGELFTIATERGDVTRLTSTPQVREVRPHWSPDGKWIAFVGDTDGREEVWLCDERGGQLKKISNRDSEKGQIVWAPDGKALLYTGSDHALCRYDLDGGKTTVLTTGEVATFGGQAIGSPQWSPDGKWVSFTKSGKTLLPHVYVMPSEGGEARRITDADTYSDSSAHWTADGKHLVYLSGTDTGNIGQEGRSAAQIFVVALQPEERNPLDRNIDSEEQAVKAERQPPRGGPGAGRPADRPPPEVKIDFERIARRARQLTRSADAIGNLAMTPDRRGVIFTTSGTEGGRSVQSIWSQGLDGDRLTRLVQSAPTGGDEEETPARGRFGGGFTGLQVTRDGRSLFYLQGNGIYSVALGGGAAPTESAGTGGGRGTGRGALRGATPAATTEGSGQRVNFTARVEIDHRQERKQVFQEAWRVMKHRFYDPAMHGVDWDRMRTVYEPLLEHVADQEELHNVVSQMIGELNASHTGISGGTAEGGRGEQTRFPGFELEPDASGFYKVTHVYKNGPADKDYVKINSGDFVLAVDGQDLKAGDNYWRQYTTAASSRLEFTVNNKPAKEGAWQTKVTPVSSTQYANLQYQRWVADRRAAVDRMSNGEIGYLHIRQMNEPSLRQFERDLAMNKDKKALVIDQRFNPGGSIDQELLEILGQRQYQYTKLRDSIEVTRPFRAFFGPMAVLANERSTSDAEVFPDGFKTLKLGKVIGVTTYGAVIGTGAYRLMDGSTIRTPGSGLWNVKGTNLENYGVPPDVYIDNTPEDFLKGNDAQLAKAVGVLQEELKNKK